MRKTRHYFVDIHGETLEVEITPDEGQAVVGVDGQNFVVTGSYVPGEGVQSLVINGEEMRFRVEPRDGHLYISRHGSHALVRTLSETEHGLYGLMPEKVPVDRSNLVISPMPGKVVALRVAVGDAVRAGQELCVIEAMKMENLLLAERDGTIEELLTEAGATVDADQILMKLAVDAS